MAKSKLKKCKACGTEISKSAKICPNCGAKSKKKYPIFIGILVLIILVAAIGSMGGDDEPKKVETNATAQGETDNSATVDKAPIEETPATEKPADKEEKTMFSVGETAELNGVIVSLVSVSENTGSAYNTPTEGNVFVLCEFEIANNSDTEITVSSMMSFDAYCDDYTCTYSLSALMEKGNKNQLDGTVASGKKFNGVIGYEVPADWQELEIHFTPDFWRGKEIVFIATND